MINNLLEYAKKENLTLEVYAIQNNEITIEYQNDSLANYKIQDIKEYKLKAIIDGVSVTSSVLDISNPKEVIEILKSARELTDELDNDFLAEPTGIDNTLRDEVKIEPTKIKEKLKSFNQELKNKYPEIFSIYTEYNFEKNKYEIHNTNNVNMVDSNYHGYYFSDIVLKIDDDNLTVDKYVIAKNPDFEKFKSKVIEGIKYVLKKHNAKSVKTDKYQIILDKKCVYDILSSFALDFHAQNIDRKQSVFTDALINQKIFNEKVNIIEDPTNKELIGTRLFDGEGVKTYLKKVVDNGVFKTKLYNKKYAEKNNTKSTGNSYGVKNLYIEPGDKKVEDLISSLSSGIYIDYLMGLHTGINHLTGDISIQCEGYNIKNGKITEGLKQIILSTNIFELFNNVKEIANDLEFFSTTGGAPSILIENITITGKEV